MLFASLGRRQLLSCLGRIRSSLGRIRFLGFLGGSVLVSGKLNLTLFSARDVLFSVDVNLRSVAVNADGFVFLVAALFRISTHPWPVSGLLPGSYKYIGRTC